MDRRAEKDAIQSLRSYIGRLANVRTKKQFLDTLDILEAERNDYREVCEDHKRVVRELDVAMNGEEGAAQQASLVDLVAQFKRCTSAVEITRLATDSLKTQYHHLVNVMPDVWNAITPADRQFMTAMMHGLLTARAKYPGNANRYVAFTGEAGETMDAWAKMVYGRCSVLDMASELRQAAQMACRLAVEGDSSLPIHLQTQFPCIVWPSSERR